MIGVQTPSGNRNIGVVSVLTLSGARNIGRVSMLAVEGDLTLYEAGGAGAFDVSITPPSIASARAVAHPVAVTTPYVEAVPAGGSAPFTYSWDWSSSDGSSWSATNPAVARTAFTCGAVGDGEVFSATFIVTVTDALGRSAQQTILVTASNYGDLSRGYAL